MDNYYSSTDANHRLIFNALAHIMDSTPPGAVRLVAIGTGPPPGPFVHGASAIQADSPREENADQIWPSADSCALDEADLQGNSEVPPTWEPQDAAASVPAQSPQATDVPPATEGVQTVAGYTFTSGSTIQNHRHAPAPTAQDVAASVGPSGYSDPLQHPAGDIESSSLSQFQPVEPRSVSYLTRHAFSTPRPAPPVATPTGIRGRRQDMMTHLPQPHPHLHAPDSLIHSKVREAGSTMPASHRVRTAPQYVYQTQCTLPSRSIEDTGLKSRWSPNTSSEEQSTSPSRLGRLGKKVRRSASNRPAQAQASRYGYGFI